MQVVLDAKRWGWYLAGMPQYDVRVFLALVFMARGSYTVAFKNEQLISKSGVCKSLVQRAIWDLAKRGMLKVVQRIGGNYNRTIVDLSPDWVEFHG
jgi:predicted transcriptional regulator